MGIFPFLLCDCRFVLLPFFVFVYLNRYKRWQRLSLQLLNRREFYAKLRRVVATVCKSQHDLELIAASFQ